MLNLKLFIVMGISWLLEITATIFYTKSTWWTISDVFNLLQGVLIFLIFVFKRKVLVAFQKKLGKLESFLLQHEVEWKLLCQVPFVKLIPLPFDESLR